MLRPRSKQVTLVDVARQSGFSPATVSIVLNDAPLARNVKEPVGDVRRLVEALDPFSGFTGGLEQNADLLRHKVKFTALVAFDDLTALGAMRALAYAGLRVPEDCSVIGFDDAPLAAFCTPGLTTIRQPMEDMGILATAWVLKAAQGEEEDDSPPAAAQMLTPTVVVRESTRIIKK
jgi:LacI family transcriptional regulator